jgi:hypothetical protein
MVKTLNIDVCLLVTTLYVGIMNTQKWRIFNLAKSENFKDSQFEILILFLSFWSNPYINHKLYHREEIGKVCFKFELWSVLRVWLHMIQLYTILIPICNNHLFPQFKCKGAHAITWATPTPLALLFAWFYSWNIPQKLLEKIFKNHDNFFL